MKQLIEEIRTKLLTNEENNCIYKNNENEADRETECVNDTQTDPVWLQYAEEDRGQMDGEVSALEINFPAALVNIPKIGYESAANFVQKGDAAIVVRLFAEKNSADENDAASIWDVMENTNRRLHGKHFLSSEIYSYGVLNRTRVRKIKREDAYMELELHYSLQFMDISCMRTLHRKPSPISLPPDELRG